MQAPPAPALPSPQGTADRRCAHGSFLRTEASTPSPPLGSSTNCTGPCSLHRELAGSRSRSRRLRPLGETPVTQGELEETHVGRSRSCHTPAPCHGSTWLTSRGDKIFLAGTCLARRRTCWLLARLWRSILENSRLSTSHAQIGFFRSQTWGRGLPGNLAVLSLLFYTRGPPSQPRGLEGAARPTALQRARGAGEGAQRGGSRCRKQLSGGLGVLPGWAPMPSLHPFSGPPGCFQSSSDESGKKGASPPLWGSY